MRLKGKFGSFGAFDIPSYYKHFFLQFIIGKSELDENWQKQACRETTENNSLNIILKWRKGRDIT